MANKARLYIVSFVFLLQRYPFIVVIFETFITFQTSLITEKLILTH